MQKPRKAQRYQRCRYDADLDAAFEQARVGGDSTPLLDTVRRW